MEGPASIDAQFNRAVDIVQSLPKSGPVQTSYEEKLGLYALYKQATEGDIQGPRPGILDLLGRAKWDSWNKRKGVPKREAKHLYVASLLRILKKHPGTEVDGYVVELESFTRPTPLAAPDRPDSPASSTSSYHSSQASPPDSPPQARRPRIGHDVSDQLYSAQQAYYGPPDPDLPPPDVAPGYLPPSALDSSHKSLLNLAAYDGQEAHAAHASTPSLPGPSVSHPAYHPAPYSSSLPASRAHSLVGGATSRKDSLYSIRRHQPPTPSALGYVPESHPQAGPSRISHPVNRDYAATPDPALLSPNLNMGIYHPSPAYPRPASTSTFSQGPHPVPMNMAVVLQQIQTSLTAVHERLSTLERTQAAILRRQDRRSAWWWQGSWQSADERDMDAEEDQDVLDRARGWATTTRTGTKARANRRPFGKGLGLRLVWGLLRAIRRAMLDLSMGALIMVILAVILGGGWRRARFTLSRLWTRSRRFIMEQ